MQPIVRKIIQDMPAMHSIPLKKYKLTYVHTIIVKTLSESTSIWKGRWLPNVDQKVDSKHVLLSYR